ncbi:MAG: hypothetical protein OJF59_000615 [Cytophagales bacterium]|nr:MAG: hypothetical protein OJF59_000615 [Cytophagales bacterium]
MEFPFSGYFHFQWFLIAGTIQKTVCLQKFLPVLLANDG